jgi:endoglucanase
MGQDLEGVWQRTLFSYLQTNHLSYAYWAWNADSGDTGGILNNDWTTVNQSKMDVLSAYQWPLLGQKQTGSTNQACNTSSSLRAFAWPPSK